MTIIDLIIEYIGETIQRYQKNDLYTIEHIVIWYRDKKTGELKTSYI